MSEELLTLANVEAAYGAMKAIRGVSLSVKRGSIVTILGSNGAGKTTILRTISGLLDPLKGTITFKGESIACADPATVVRRGISHSPEGREVFPLITVRQNLLMGAYLRDDRDAVQRDIEMVERYFPILRERADQEAGLLSGGQQQMLSISRALMSKPELLLLDEPSLGLSPKLTQQIFAIVKRINEEQGVTILLVEQNAPLALETADFGYVLEVGRIVMEGPTAELRQKDDIREFYLGKKETGARSQRRWKKKKLWR